MMYDNKFVAALKVNGKILREVKDIVFVKFGSEYSILLKNLNSVRALVNIQIDGQEVCPGGLVLDANRGIAGSVVLPIGTRLVMPDYDTKTEDTKLVSLWD